LPIYPPAHWLFDRWFGPELICSSPNTHQTTPAIVIAGLVWFSAEGVGESVLNPAVGTPSSTTEKPSNDFQQANAALIVAQEDLANAQTKAERIRIGWVARADAYSAGERTAHG